MTDTEQRLRKIEYAERHLEAMKEARLKRFLELRRAEWAVDDAFGELHEARAALASTQRDEKP